MNLEKITELTAKDMMAVNIEILQQLQSRVTLINQMSHHIIDSGGKRLRPMVAILVARALNYEGNKHITVAAMIEFIHTATLLHDDVVDASDMRRGKVTANAAFGNAASVLVGDFIYTRAFQMITRLKSFRVLALMSEAVNVIAEGEMLQLMNLHNPDITEESYMKVIHFKTARLFEVAAQSSAILSGADYKQEKALQHYGRYLGTAFQLIDDLLDYNANSSVLGKKTGDDLHEGKPTLPMLHAMQHSDKTQRAMLREAIARGDKRYLLEAVLQIMQQYGSLNYTYNRAMTESHKAVTALQMLPKSQYRDALEGLAKLAAQREF